MNMADPAEVGLWLSIYEDAFGRPAGPEDFRQLILEHPHVVVTHTFFILDGEEPVGVFSSGHFRRNPSVATRHYIAIVRRFQGKGLALRVLRNIASPPGDGYSCFEGESTIGRKAAHALAFDRGSRPKYRRDYWNTPVSTHWPMRVVAAVRLWLQYHQWARRDRRSSDRGVSGVLAR
jgi:hypothetical protein